LEDVVRERRISGRQIHMNVEDAPDLIFEAHPHLAATETANSAILEKGALIGAGLVRT